MRFMVVNPDSGPMVYCKACGAVPGTATECACWDHHVFVTTAVPLICRGCGAMPGSPSKCRAWDSHSFIPVPKPTDN